MLKETHPRLCLSLEGDSSSTQNIEESRGKSPAMMNRPAMWCIAAAVSLASWPTAEAFAPAGRQEMPRRQARGVIAARPTSQLRAKAGGFGGGGFGSSSKPKKNKKRGRGGRGDLVSALSDDESKPKKPSRTYVEE